MSIVETYYIKHMKKMDNCEPTTKADGSLDLDISDCMQEVDNEVPSLIVSPRLYRFLKYKNIQVLR